MRTIPITVVKDGSKRIVGEVQIDDDNNIVSSAITDPEYSKELLTQSMLQEFSIERKNVFDKDKDQDGF